MNVSVEKQDKNTAKIIVTIPASDFAKAVAQSFLKNKSKYVVPGFRKGHAPQAMIEKAYGDGVFFEDAVNQCIDDTYSDALKESGLDVVSRARFDLEKIAKGEDLVYTALVATKPEVKLGEYLSMKLPKVDSKVSEEDLENALKKEQEKNARVVAVTDRAAQMDDTVTLDYDGSVDGIPFDGGKAEDYSLTLGSGTFIPGFEDQVCGHNIDEAFDVNVTFPEDYHAKDLAGKAAVFACKLKDIKTKVLPEINDEFASEVSEFDTLEEYKADLKKTLDKAAKENARIKKENAVVEKAAAEAEVELPDLMVETKIDSTIEDYARQMQSQGLSLDDYMKYTGMDMAKLREQVKEQAVNDLKVGLVLEAIADKEDVQVTDKAVDDEIKKMAESYEMKYEDIVKMISDDEKDNIRQNLRIREAVAMLVKASKFTLKKENA